jgi:hypothetical protein
MIHDTSNTPLSDFELQMKQMKRQYEEAKYIYNQRKGRVSSCLDSWVRSKGFNVEIKNINKLEKLLWEKLNIGTSMPVIFEQIDKFHDEM